MNEIGRQPANVQHERIWEELEAGVQHGSHPFHTAALATVDAMPGGLVRPEVRTVVIREADRSDWSLIVHTDRRSPKAGEVSKVPAVSLVLYDAERRWQLRLRGTAHLHAQDELARRRWEALATHSRACYRNADPPSSLRATGSRAETVGGVQARATPGSDRARRDTHQSAGATAGSACPVGAGRDGAHADDGPAGAPGDRPAGEIRAPAGEGRSAADGAAGAPGDRPAGDIRASAGESSSADDGFERFAVVLIRLQEIEALFLDHVAHARYVWRRGDAADAPTELAP